MVKIEQLEKEEEIARAKYKVAGDLGWIISIFAGVICDLEWQTGWWSIIIAIAVYFVVIHRYSKQADAATDAYHREARIGKYFDVKAP